MSQINHYVVRNGRLVPKHQQQPPKARTFSTNVLQSPRSTAHKKEIEAIKTEYEGKLLNYESKIRELEAKLKERDQEAGPHHEPKLTNLWDSKTYQEATTLTVDANSVCHSFKLRSVEARSFRQGLREINTERFINRSSMSSRGKNSSSKMSSSEYLNASEIIINEPELSTSRSMETSNLLTRIDKSQALVSNIMKFLDTPSCQISEPKEQNQSYTFANQVLNKHQDILRLLQVLEEERQRELQELKDHYEEALLSQLSGRKQDNIIRIEPWSHRRNWGDILKGEKQSDGNQEDCLKYEEHNNSLLCFDDQQY